MVFPELFVAHRAYVTRVLGSLGVAEAELPDATQEVFLVVHRRLESFEGRSTLRTWLYGICLRVASEQRRRARRRREQLRDEVPDVGREGSQYDAVLLAETADVIERALARLPESQRRVFVMYELEQRPMDEVARALGCKRKTGFTRLYAARRRVNAALRRGGCGVLLLPARPRSGALPGPPLPTSASVAAPWVAGLGIAAACLLSLLGPAPHGATLASLPRADTATATEPATASESATEPESAHSATEPESVSESASVTEPASESASESVSPRVSLPGFAVERLGSPSVALVLHRIGPVDVVPLYSVHGLAPSPPAPVPAPVRTRLAPELTARRQVLQAIYGR